jgi:hypothetical protein
MTEVDSEEDEEVLSSRLALARVRMVGGLRIEPLGTIPMLPEAPP